MALRQAHAWLFKTQQGGTCNHSAIRMKKKKKKEARSTGDEEPQIVVSFVEFGKNETALQESDTSPKF